MEESRGDLEALPDVEMLISKKLVLVPGKRKRDEEEKPVKDPFPFVIEYCLTKMKSVLVKELIDKFLTH